MAGRTKAKASVALDEPPAADPSPPPKKPKAEKAVEPPASAEPPEAAETSSEGVDTQEEVKSPTKAPDCQYDDVPDTASSEEELSSEEDEFEPEEEPERELATVQAGDKKIRAQQFSIKSIEKKKGDNFKIKFETEWLDNGVMDVNNQEISKLMRRLHRIFGENYVEGIGDQSEQMNLFDTQSEEDEEYEEVS